MSKDSRTEKDFLGKIQVPSKAYYGAHTARAKKNFQISGIRAPKIFREALGMIKLAAVEANSSLKLIPTREANAIKKACKEFIEGKLNEDFDLDVFQAGAGTPFNMNANEVIANRANEILGGRKGEYKFVHPNNHVNMAQSSNDVIPAATRIAVLFMLPALLSEIAELEKEIGKKQKQYANIVKVGRTHLQDAVPITFGQELDSYRQAIQKSREFISRQSEDLQILGLGGTAVGTGINTDPLYKDRVIKTLSTLTGIQFQRAKNSTEILNNMNAFMNFSASLRSIATNLLNISLDLKIMSSGPKTGLHEVSLPEVQAGSSIMPGKINPSILESMEMVAMQILGNDKTIELAAQRSHFELNTNCPVIMHNLLQSMEILTNTIKNFRERCIKGLKVDKARVKELFEKSFAPVTALVPYIGYESTADIVKSALKKGITIKEELLSRKLLPKTKIDKILSPEYSTKPQKIKKAQ